MEKNVNAPQPTNQPTAPLATLIGCNLSDYNPDQSNYQPTDWYFTPNEETGCGTFTILNYNGLKDLLSYLHSCCSEMLHLGPNNQRHISDDDFYEYIDATQAISQLSLLLYAHSDPESFSQLYPNLHFTETNNTINL